MKQIKYTPDAADKLRAIKKAVSLQYGSKKAKEVVGSIVSAIRSLVDYEESGPTVEGMFGVACDYRYIFVSRNYVFYRVEDDLIKIINIYNEKEDFMWLLFGVDTTPQETLTYWKE